jgi:hypothetical protein
MSKETEGKAYEFFGINVKSPSLLVFGATIIGYGMAYCYELGYLRRYNIDTSFISISISQIFTSALLVLVFTIILDVLWAIYKVARRRYDPDNVIHRTILYLSFLTLLLTVVLILCKIDFIHIEYKRIGYPVIVLVYFGVILLSFAKIAYAGYKSRDYYGALKEAYAASDAARQEHLSQYDPEASLNLTILPKLLTPIFILLILAFACATAGYTSAGYMDRYVTVISSQTNSVEFVVSNFNGTIITKEYDTQTKSLHPDYRVRNTVGNSYTRRVIRCTSSFKHTTAKTNDVLRHCPN